MKRNWRAFNKEKHQFKSYYCSLCRQQKPCHLLTGQSKEWSGYCCPCYYSQEEESSQVYTNYQPVYQQEKQAQLARIQQLKLLREYSGCAECNSKEVDAYQLYENNQLVCQPCRMKKEGGSSSPISFSGQSRWYQQRWGINLSEWLDTYNCLPINANCARKWLKDKQHLNNCVCLAEKAQVLHELFTNSLRKLEEKLKECQCETSPKVRVDSDNYTTCQGCEKTIAVAHKKRIIKNRNDPHFWGLNVKAKVLCGECLKNLVGQMPVNKKYTFKKYQKRGCF